MSDQILFDKLGFIDRVATRRDLERLEHSLKMWTGTVAAAVVAILAGIKYFG
jgi:hypothetical protein